VESDVLLDSVLGWEAGAGDLPPVFEEVAGDFEEFFHLLVHFGWWFWMDMGDGERWARLWRVDGGVCECREWGWRVSRS